MQNRSVFAVVNNSSFAFLSYRFLLEQGVPDDRRRLRRHLLRPARQRGPRLRDLGNVAGRAGVTYDDLPEGDEEDRGDEGRRARRTASRHRRPLPPRTSRSSRCPRSGSKPCTPTPPSTSAPPTSARRCSGSRTPGADAVYLPHRGVVQLRGRHGGGAERRGIKSTILATGYGQDLLDQPIAAQLGPEVTAGHADSRRSS